MSFLAVTKKTVVDTPAQPEVLDTDGVTVITPAVAAVTHEEVDQLYIEDAAAQVAINMANNVGIDYYSIKVNPTTLKPTLRTVREKGRTAAPAKEVVTIEDQDGVELGSGMV